MRSDIEEYKKVEEAAMKFVKSVREGNSKYAKELFIDEAVLFGYLDGELEHGSIEQFYDNVDSVPGGDNFNARIDVLLLEETLAVVRVLEEGWGNRIDFTDVLLLLKMNNEWKCVAKAYNQNSNTIKKIIEEIKKQEKNHMRKNIKTTEAIFPMPVPTGSNI